MCFIVENIGVLQTFSGQQGIYEAFDHLLGIFLDELFKIEIVASVFRNLGFDAVDLDRDPKKVTIVFLLFSSFSFALSSPSDLINKSIPLAWNS